MRKIITGIISEASGIATWGMCRNVFLPVGTKRWTESENTVKSTLEMLSGNIRGGELKDEE